MKRFFEKVEIDQTFATALEKRLVAVYNHENRSEWRGIVWPMATFGTLLIIVVTFIGLRYFDNDKMRTKERDFEVIEIELDQVQTDMTTDTDINQAIEYVSM